jgi:ABC-2 family transporter protein
MRPYLAVVRDSFHAALSSRILWVAFVAIWLLMAALAPIGFVEDLTTTFRGRDFQNGTRMKAMLASGLLNEQAKQTAIGRLATAMPEELLRQLEQVSKGEEVRISFNALVDGLNKLLDDERWYDAEAWKATLRLRELRELDERPADELTDSLRRRRARLRIEAALPGVFGAHANRSITLSYAGYVFPATFNVDKPQFVTLVNQFVMPFIIDWLLGFILVMLGILVTASVIPDMLQPGSLHLLLSKPVSRTMLLLSKFIGGCAFVLLCVIQLVIGLYLIAGFRLDIWNPRLMWCIPVSVFLFSVFYSVSVLAGLRWRSPILSIGVTVIFGAICLVVGVVGGFFDGFVTRPATLQSIAVAGDNIFASTRGQGLVRFDREQNRWIDVFESDAMGGDMILPPVAISDETIVTANSRNARFNPYGSGALDLLVLSKASDWTPEPSLRLPTATSRVYRAGDKNLLALNTGELAMTTFQAVMSAAGETSENEPASEPEEGGLFAKLNSMMGGLTTGFTAVLPDRMALTPPRDLVVAPDGQWLLAITSGRLIRLQRPATDSGTWKLETTKTLEGDATQRSVLALSNKVCLVARENEPVTFFDAQSLDEIGTHQFPDSISVVSGIGLKDQRFALILSTGECQILRLEPDGKVTSQTLDFREVESLHLRTGTNDLYVAHHVDQLDVLDADEFSTKAQIRPALDRWRLIDRYVMTPLRTIVPRTGELGQTIAAMVSGKSSITFGAPNQEEVIRYNIFQPVLSCVIFIAVMLTISCVYFSTRDF